ncbi:hypothetical protein BBX50_12235 [Ensifer sp. LC11]|nr:hypothetical protein BBX50_12235 [Ensifer sp. LC11]
MTKVHPNHSRGEIIMRKFIIAAAVAVTAAISFAAPSQAGSISIGFGHGHYGHGWGGQIGYVGGHYGGRYYYDDEPYCFIKKVKRYDHYGNVYFKKIRICR